MKEQDRNWGVVGGNCEGVCPISWFFVGPHDSTAHDIWGTVPNGVPL